MIPGNLGALEASNVAVVEALGLAGGGSLALVRRVRGLLFAPLGLLFIHGIAEPAELMSLLPPFRVGPRTG